MRTLDRLAVRDWPLPQPGDDSDKEDLGQVLVVAGCREIPGAALLAATAALRAGAGKLTIATAQSVAPGLALLMPEARVIGLPETPAGGLLASSVEQLAPCAESCSAVLVGPGLLDSEASCEFVGSLLRQLTGVPVILDALAMDVVLQVRRFDQPVLLTPHAGEMAHLSGQSKDDAKADAPALARDMALKHNAVIALKGASTFIIPPEGESWCHVWANASMGTSGSGDVLAGIITGLAARGAPLEQAAACGVVLHALAGQRLAERHGRLGFLAREILKEIPSVMRDL